MLIDDINCMILIRDRLVDFPARLLQMPRLTSIDLSSNKITTLPNEISKLTNLVLLVCEK